MGRWAQRRRGRGGGGGPLQISMISAEVQAFDEIKITYNAPVDAGDFNSPSDFQTHPSNEFGTGLTNTSATELSLAFGASISGEATLEFNGSPPPTNVLNPQTVAIT